MEEKIRNAIRLAIAAGKRNFIIYPFGKQGKLFKKILNDEFSIKETLIIDNGNESAEDNVRSLEEIETAFYKDCTVFIVSDNTQIFFELRSLILQYVPNEYIFDVVTNAWGTIDIRQEILKRDKVKIFFNPLKRFYKAESVGELGNNTGNLVYAEAMREQLDYDIEAWLPEKWARSRLGKGNITSIMPASNFVSDYATWCENLIPALEDTDMKFTFAGLGAQASFEETPKDVVAKLSDRQKYFFRLVSEHAVQIGVRGEFTAECLNLLGIFNVEVIGCPSFYQYKEKYPILPEPTSEKILYTADCTKEKIYSLAGKTDSYLICQNYEDSAGKGTIFYDFGEWNNYIVNSQFTFAFGSRFHGNMMALRNKIPTLWIVHDWRTLELVQYLGLPYVNYYDKKFQKVKYIQELMEYCDYEKVYERYPQLNERYSEFIRKNFDDNFRRSGKEGEIE